MRIIISLLIILLNCFSVFAINSVDLINNAHKYDGQVIEYKGEVIGDIMRRGDNAWLNVNDGKNAIGIWASEDMVREIKVKGDYRNIGDLVLVRGYFNRACAEHGGDLDIHAHNIRVLEVGYPIEREVNQTKLWIALFLFIGILIVVIVPRLIKTIH
jgi:hypothetical protein